MHKKVQSVGVVLCVSVAAFSTALNAAQRTGAATAGAIAVPDVPPVIERSGDGRTDSRWNSKHFPVEPNATYMLTFDACTRSGSGTMVSGVKAVNVDIRGPMDWKRQSYVFRTDAAATRERLHFGQWHLNGTASFRGARLEKVRAVHAETFGMTLGEGEMIEGGTYRFTSAFSGFARNDSRTLLGVKRTMFNSYRWCIRNGSEVEYRHAVRGRRFQSAKLRFQCGYWNSGAAYVEVSDGKGEWHRVGALDSVSEFVFDAPGTIFPCDALHVRIVGVKGTGLQIHSYAVDAAVDGDVLWATGNTRYVSEATGKDVGGGVKSPYFDDDYGEAVAGDTSAVIWRASSGRKIHPNRMPPKARAASLEISTAPNEAEAVQLVVSPSVDMADVRVSLSSGLQGKGGCAIPSSAVDILRVDYVPVSQVTDVAGVRGLWPDPLPPQDAAPLAVPAKANKPFWVRVKPPKGTPKGVYTGTLSVLCRQKGGESATFNVPLSVEVFGFEFPDHVTCETAFGMNLRNPWSCHAAKTPAQKELIADRYLDALAYCHLSPYNPSPCASWTVKWKNGYPEFDWGRWDKAVEKAVNERHVNAFNMRVAGLGGGTFHSRWQPSINGVPSTNEQYHVLMGRYLKGIESHLREKGWLDLAYVYWFDEPSPKDYDFVNDGFRTLKRHAPGLRRMLTEQIEPALVGGPNVWCPHNSNLDFKLADERRAAGETIWWYVCCMPKAPYTGLFIDHPSNELRTWLWQTWGQKVTGILIWESLHWTSRTAYPDSPQNPYKDPMSWMHGYGLAKGTKRGWGNGDGRLFYPPVALADWKAKSFTDGEPVGSFRSEALRDGLEDYEYFVMLKRLDPDNALLKVPESVYSSMTKFSTDPVHIENHRMRLAREIERLSRK